MLHNQIHQIFTELRKTPKITKIQDGRLNFGHMKILNIPPYIFGHAKHVGERIFQIRPTVEIL